MTSLQDHGKCTVSKSEGGMVLIITLMALAIITALVVEFSYGVYVNTTFLNNWRSSKKLSSMAASGVTLASKFVTGVVGRLSYTYPSFVEMPASDVFDDGSGTVLLRIEDENSKFNINSIVHSNNELHVEAYDAFKRLLEELGLEEGVADRIADWIDRDDLPRLSDSEKKSKNAPLDSADELLLIPGITGEVYDKLIPYITVFGKRDVMAVNINGADVAVLMSLNGDITREMAERIVSRRDARPFEKTGDIAKVPGFEKQLGADLTKHIVVKAEMFRVISTASDLDGMKRIVDCVLDQGGAVRYWKEI